MAALGKVGREGEAQHVYLWGIAACGVAFAVYAPAAHPEVFGFGLLWLFLGFLVLLELLTTRLTRVRESTDFGAGTILAFAALLSMGTVAAVVVFAWGSLVHGVARGSDGGNGVPLPLVGVLRRVAFNVGQAALSLVPPGVVVAALTGRQVLAVPESPEVIDDLLVVMLAALAFFITNLLLVATAIRSMQQVPLQRSLRVFLSKQGSVMLVMLSFAPVVAVVIEHAFQLTPLLVILLAAMYHSARVFRASQQQASQDPLTRLPNRLLFNTRLEEALEGVRREGGFAAVLLADLDDFKAVNDTHGHRAGDEVLHIVSQRLSAAVRSTDTVARLGGDEFGVVLPRLRAVADAEIVAEAVKATFGDPISVGGVQVALGASVGTAVYPDHGADADGLLHHADSDMYRAKRAQAGPVRPHVADPPAREPTARRGRGRQRR